MIVWPEKLIDAIARRRCVLFLGAGVSANSQNSNGKNPATWESFLKTILTKEQGRLKSHENEINRLLETKDYLLACEIIVNELGDRDFGEFVASEFRRPGYKPSEIHKIIFSLDSKVVVTPNIDKIYEQYASNASDSTVVAKSYSDKDLAKYLRTNDYLIVRAHGHVDESSKMIFTHGQYSRARNEYAAFYRLLDALILTHTFVFIGCGINDPDIQLMLENANFLYEDCPPHYFIAAENAMSLEMQKILDKNRNLQILTYENADGAHKNLLNELKILCDSVDEKRIKLSENYSW